MTYFGDIRFGNGSGRASCRSPWGFRCGFALLFTCALAVGLSLSRIASSETIVENGTTTRIDAKPERLQGIDIIEHLDEVLPLKQSFRNTSGQRVALSDIVDGTRPVIFTLNYSDCPMLCSLQLNGLVAAVKQLALKLGEDFEVVTVSLDPNESSERASETRGRYLRDLGVALEPGIGWHFLTGDQSNINAIAEAMGIAYAYNEARKEYVHPAALVIATPDGRVARYLYGIEYHPRTLTLSLVEAAAGKIGSSIDRFILYCFHYDETEGRYAPVAMNVMRAGGGLTVLALGGFLGAFWLRQLRRKPRRSKQFRRGTALPDLNDDERHA